LAILRIGAAASVSFFPAAHDRDLLTQFKFVNSSLTISGSDFAPECGGTGQSSRQLQERVGVPADLFPDEERCLPRNKKRYSSIEVKFGNGDCNAVSLFALYPIRSFDVQPT